MPFRIHLLLLDKDDHVDEIQQINYTIYVEQNKNLSKTSFSATGAIAYLHRYLDESLHNLVF